MVVKEVAMLMTFVLIHVALVTCESRENLAETNANDENVVKLLQEMYLNNVLKDEHADDYGEYSSQSNNLKI